MSDTVHVIGASGRSGAALARALLARGGTVVPVVRDPARLAAVLPPQPRLAPPRVAGLADAGALAAALADATAVVSTAHARFTAQVLAAAPVGARLVLLGSTRRFTRWPDAHGSGVIAGEAALLGSGRAGVMLHPTMIYGAQGEDNVQRLAA
ncbi:MAG: NAD(P)H-binding protein, partial [Alphaproteobacteria bacterium]|nr:NAD(P)H-binding protein [Alphaproteobacteria bacterium]